MVLLWVHSRMKLFFYHHVANARVKATMLGVRVAAGSSCSGKEKLGFTMEA
jgi:hypothetical protein